jgi:hypothetical protein
MSTKRLQVVLTEEAWATVDALATEANNSFDSGHINYSNLINEMILSAKIDLKTLQLKHTDLRRSLRVLAAQKNIDLDTAIRTLSEIKNKIGKRPSKVPAREEVTNE